MRVLLANGIAYLAGIWDNKCAVTDAAARRPRRVHQHKTGADLEQMVKSMSQASDNIAAPAASGKAATRSKSKPAAQAPTRQAATQGQRTVVTFITAQRACPDATLVGNIVRVFGMPDVDYHAIREATEEQIARSAKVLADNLSEKALEMHLQRIVDAFVRSAHGAGTFYETKASLARDASSKVANQDRDEDRQGVDGTANRAARAREFTATVALQAFALLAAAEGAVDAYAHVTGNDWKPYEGATRPAMAVDRQVAAAQMAALGM